MISSDIVGKNPNKTLTTLEFWTEVKRFPKEPMVGYLENEYKYIKKNKC
jgi:hypothetical protein